MQKPRKILLTGIIVVIAAVAALLWYRSSLARPWTRDGKVRAQVVEVTPRVTAPIVALPIRDNQFVRAGDRLFQLDPSDFELGLDSAQVRLDQAHETVASLQAAVRAAEAQANEARAGVVSAESQIRAAEASVQSAHATVAEAEASIVAAQAAIARSEAAVQETKREATRARRLADQKAGSVEVAESKQSALAAAQAQLQSTEAGKSEAVARLAGAQARLSQAEANLVITQNGLKEAQATLETALANLDQATATLGQPGDANVRVRQAQVALEQARLQLARTCVNAPVDGYVTNLSLQLGDHVVANQPALALVDVNSFWIDAYFKETQLEGMGVGDEAVVTLMTYPDRPIRGRLIGIGWGIAQQDGSTSNDLLPSVSPTFEWIRLAQRIPVQIGDLELPDGVDLRVGATASVLVRKSSRARTRVQSATERQAFENDDAP